jgi:signal transduction histidine kinase
MNDEKNEFMGIAAHDLRSPLNAIKGYAEMLLEDTPLNQEQTDLVRRVHDATKRMVEMVQNLLDVNTIERGEMKLNSTPCDLSALTRGVVDTFQPIATAKQQTLDLEGTATPMPVLVDPALTVQVLENLVSNAIKYSPIGKTVTVCISTSGAKARCAVRDQGPGLSADDQKKLFGKFARLSAKPTAGEPSIGLGLSIVKRMMESMGGRVWCESELGSGATFLVEFPVSTG